MPIRIGVSMCLLGEKVRHDGGHKRDHYLSHTLAEFFEWVPVCPEVEVGMGTPREAIHLVQLSGEVRLGRPAERGRPHRCDALLCATAGRAAREPEPQRVHLEEGLAELRAGLRAAPSRARPRDMIGTRTVRRRTGRSARQPADRRGRPLCDPRLRENWIERVFAYHRLQTLWATRWRVGDLVAFHTSHKLVLLAHSPQAFQQLGRLVAASKTLPRGELRECYEREFMAALTKLATRGRHTNVLQHMVGYFRDQLDDASRRELLGCIEDYRRSLVPLIVPITLVAHYVRRFDVEYLKGQVYLNPHPKELALRNHV